MERVKCEICKKIMTSEEALKHKEQRGHNSWTLMLNNPDLIEMFEVDLDRLILVGHKQGMTYPVIFHAILERLAEMVLQCTAEQWLGMPPNET